MIRRLALVLVLLCPPINFAEAQAPRIPRDFSKLVTRAQNFWTAIAANQRLKALDFVLPDKKEFLLSNGGMPFVNPQIVGIDFTGDVNRATVRVSVKTIAQEGPSNWIVSETWVWERNNWFLDIQDPLTGVNPFIPSRKSADPPATLAEAEARFKILDTAIDVGTIAKGSVRRIPVRVEYTGDVPISIVSDLQSDLLGLELSSSQGITAKTKEFVIVLNAEAWDGPFALPYPLKVHYKGITLDRTVVVRGNVYAPVSVTQKPSPFVSTPGGEVTLVLRNNTTEPLSIASVGSEAAFSVVRLPENISAGGEGELILRLNPDAQAEVNHPIRLNLSQPFLGKQDYYLTLRVQPNP